jgi:thiamine biosynthesis protein ThiS
VYVFVWSFALVLIGVLIGDIMKVNGEKIEFREGMTVSELVVEMGFSEAMVAVELNLDILPRDSFSSTVLKENDCIEVVRFVGGG